MQNQKKKDPRVKAIADFFKDFGMKPEMEIKMKDGRTIAFKKGHEETAFAKILLNIADEAVKKEGAK